MTLLRGAEEDRYLCPGTLVRLSITVNDRDKLEPEYGVVIHCWTDTGGGKFDCLVAFWGETFPQDRPAENPYLCTYAATSLARVDDRQQASPI